MAKEAEHCPSQRIQECLRTKDTADLDPAGKIDPAGTRRRTTREKVRRKKDRWKDLFALRARRSGGLRGEQTPKAVSLGIAQHHHRMG